MTTEKKTTAKKLKKKKKINSLSFFHFFRSAAAADDDATHPFTARTSHISSPLSLGSSASSRARASRAASARRRAILSSCDRRHPDDADDAGEEGEEEEEEEEDEEEVEDPAESLLSAAIPSTVGTLSLGTSTTLFLFPPESTTEGWCGDVAQKDSSFPDFSGSTSQVQHSFQGCLPGRSLRVSVARPVRGSSWASSLAPQPPSSPAIRAVTTAEGD